MALRELPVVDTNKANAPESSNGRYGAAHARARDAYRDVPILQKPPWKNAIAAYFFLGGVSCGAFVLGTAIETIDGARRQTLAHTAHYVAFATMVPCAPLLIYDLGKRSRFHHMLRIFKPSSPMNLGAWALTAHGAMATFTTLRVLAGEGALPGGPAINEVVALLPERALSVAGLPSALTLGGYTGVLIGTSSVPVWYKSPLLGALFMASAMNTGVAAVSLVSTLTGRATPGEHRLFTPFNVALGATETVLLGAYLATTGTAAKPLLRGKLGLTTAAAAIGTLGATALDATDLLTGKNRRALGSASAAVTLLSGVALRWGLVFAGHTSAADREGTVEAMKGTAKDPGWGANAR